MCSLDLVFSPDGSALAALPPFASGRIEQTGKPVEHWDNSIRLYDTRTGKMVRKFDKANGLIMKWAFAPDGRTLATAVDGTISIWEVATGKVRCQLKVAKEQPSLLAYSPDGRLLAWAGQEPVLRILETSTGKEVGQLKGHQGRIASAAFATEGKMVATGSADTTALIWDVPGLDKLKWPQPVELESKHAERLCSDLASADAATAYLAIKGLTASPKQAVALLREQVKPVLAPDETRLAQLVADLDSKQFAVRQKAEADLEKVGELAAPALNKLLKAQPPLETQQRVERLLERAASNDSPELVRGLRAIEVLEGTGSPEARQVLQSLAKGAAGSRVTREAQVALSRLK
jgi:hypothetical protein